MEPAPLHDTAKTGDGAPDDEALLVAGLGASAGGVEALEAFFAGLPEIDGVAFVVILHLAPDEESRLADLLQATLPLPVTQVTEAVTIERGHVYVIPPGKNLLAQGRRLVLEPIEEARVRRRPIDHFFRTLAGAYGERAVGVVLSGTGANGTVGVRALKEAGGLILAQDPDDAAFDEMPRSAIASGVVDMVGPAGALAAEVVAYAHR
ncbi:chemotaxis protein CheB, partial [Rubrivirga sp.]|uniref:chemotaxis protein CheB n=1 Tax=Rubrivirga sp. TaxID=1885344 RepID=UPI003C785DFA